MTQTAALQFQAESQAGALPALLARADHLASTVLLGDHGRRRAGLGDDFWQYRPMQPGDSRRMIDWRRSARSDATFIREQEWQIAQSIMIWNDNSASMAYASDPKLPQKSDRAKLIALAVAILLNKAGERVGLSAHHIPPGRGRAQIMRLADALSTAQMGDYGTPDAVNMPVSSQAVFFSDFLGDMTKIETALGQAFAKGVRGVVVQVLDPSEEAFPFTGRTIFESGLQSVQHETLQAADLRDRYLDRLAERKDRLQSLCRQAGWQYHCHHTDSSAQSGLLWLYQALERKA